MLYSLISLLVLFWIIGMVAEIGGPFIHGLLLLAVAVFVFNLMTGRKAVV